MVTLVVKPLRAVFGLLERVLLGRLLLWLTVPAAHWRCSTEVRQQRGATSPQL
ncbi:hypothetical protein ACF3NS_06075 [Arsenicicoccus cauae]|uniref:hypothetical protein n=1 Tax=Arsenicicoccus cauae TaxID=2663847 RepID=UPI00370D4C7C